ncbi:MAG: hypothetical protein WKF91_17895 [Segetibacter sp.]
MKNTFLLALGFLATASSFGQLDTVTERSDAAKVSWLASTKNLFQWRDVSIDLKAIDPEKGYFGIDYKLNFSRKIGTLAGTKEEEARYPRNINFGIGSNGFVTVAGDKNDVNSIVNELRFEGFPIYRVPPKTAVSSGTWEDFMKTDSADGVDDPMQDPLVINAQQLAERVSAPFWLFLDIHAKHETTQDFRDFDFAFGSQLGFSTSLLNNILDLPFRLLRVGDNNNPRQLDLSIGYDYVTQIRKTALKEANEASNSMNRLNMKAEWETGIFTDKDRFVFLFDAYHALNATATLRSINKDWNTFFMAKIEHLMNYNAKTKTVSKIAIKYVKGSLPPNFTRSYVLGAGFSLEF